MDSQLNDLHLPRSFIYVKGPHPPTPPQKKKPRKNSNPYKMFSSSMEQRTKSFQPYTSAMHKFLNVKVLK